MSCLLGSLDENAERIDHNNIKKNEKMRKEDFPKKGSLDLHIRIIAYTTKRVHI